MKGRRYFIIITWHPIIDYMENRTTVIDAEENMLDKFISTLPLSEIKNIRVEENNND